MFTVKSTEIKENSVSGWKIRELCRSGEFTGPTFQSAPGFVQANLVILPKEFAFDFLLFCLRNPKPCPLLKVCDPGNPYPTKVAKNANLKTDLPKYCIIRDGESVETATDIEKYWKNDLVSFLLGCSYSWDHELSCHGLTPRHMEQGVTVPIYQSSIPLESAGPFHGSMVVSMRPYRPEQVDSVVEICSGYPAAHGTPVQVGEPGAIGIHATENGSLPEPDFGSRVELKKDEIPLFWACGVTPMAALKNAKLPFAVTHYPGHMFVTDILAENVRQKP